MHSKFVYDREKEHRKSKEKNLTGTVTDALPAQKMPSAYTIKELQLTIGTLGFNSRISFGHWLIQIRVQHLVLGSTTLECNIWSRVESH